jgi:glycerate kinase
VPGFALVAAHGGLEPALDGVELVLTGEGRLDSTSFDGKVVGGVLSACARRGIPAVVIAGAVEHGLAVPVPAYSLVERFGKERAYAEAAACVAELAAEATGRPTRSGP